MQLHLAGEASELCGSFRIRSHVITLYLHVLQSRISCFCANCRALERGTQLVVHFFCRGTLANARYSLMKFPLYKRLEISWSSSTLFLLMLLQQTYRRGICYLAVQSKIFCSANCICNVPNDRSEFALAFTENMIKGDLVYPTNP